MGARTYLPTLVKLCLVLCKFMQRYQVQIKSRLNTTQQAQFDTALAACSALEATVATLIPGGV